MGLFTGTVQLFYFFLWPFVLPVVCAIIVARRRSRFSTLRRLLFCFVLVGASAALPAYVVATTPDSERFTLDIIVSDLGIYTFTFCALCATSVVLAVAILARRVSRR